MNKFQIEQVAGLLGATVIKAPSSTGWLHFNCPMAPWTHQNGTDSNPSFGFRVHDSGESPAHCHACNWSGTLLTLIQALKFRKAEYDFKALMSLAQAEFDESDLPLPPDPETLSTVPKPYPEQWLASFPSALESGMALMYLRTRQGGPIPDSVIMALDLRWDPFRKRVCFPIRGQNNLLYGLHGRHIDPDENELKYLAYKHPQYGGTNPQVWLGENLVDWDQPVIFAESVFDLARTYQVYRNVISPLKAGVNDTMLKRVAPAFEIVTLFDPDKAGAQARKKITEWSHFSGKKRIIRHAHLGDLDAGDHTVQALADLLKNFVPLDNFLT